MELSFIVPLKFVFNHYERFQFVKQYLYERRLRYFKIKFEIKARCCVLPYFVAC